MASQSEAGSLSSAVESRKAGLHDDFECVREIVGEPANFDGKLFGNHLGLVLRSFSLGGFDIVRQWAPFAVVRDVPGLCPECMPDAREIDMRRPGLRYS